MELEDLQKALFWNQISMIQELVFKRFLENVAPAFDVHHLL